VIRANSFSCWFYILNSLHAPHTSVPLGIRLEKTPPKTPQLNGLAERMKRTLTKRVTAMLSHAMYVLNLSSVSLAGDIS
jgi:hypothetical protein